MSPFPRTCLALHLADGALQHRRIELEADGFDVSALLAAQQIAGAPQFQIQRRDLEARAQIAENSFNAASRRRARSASDLDVRRNQQIRIRPTAGRPTRPRN